MLQGIGTRDERSRRTLAVHSGPTSAPRAQSLDEFCRLDVICAVDVFNEGLDLPEEHRDR